LLLPVSWWIIWAVAKLILVVDDDEPIRNLEANVFEDAGYEVMVAGDGLAALEKIAARRPDLVTLDLVMPGLDGWGVIDRLRHIADAPPIVVVSGREGDLPHVAPGGATSLDRCVAAYVHKPFHVMDLLATCRRVLEGADNPATSPAEERRRAPRRRFFVEATVMSADGVPLALGTVTELSTGGVQLDLAAPLQPGSEVRIVFRLPNQATPVSVRGRIQWRNGLALGLALEDLSADNAQVLKEIVDPDER
jgi:DNA-binding response OmpR family regulator